MRDFLFADDCALNASSEDEMQRNMDKFSSACDVFGLTISTTKTEVMFQPAPNTNYVRSNHHSVKGQKLQTVDKFTYLGSTFSRNVLFDDEVDARIAKASTTFGRLRKNVWEGQGPNIQTRLKVYKDVVMSTLLYACETWTVHCRHARKLNRFHTNCLRRFLRIIWQDMTPDTDVLKRAGLQSIHALLEKAQLRWAGHVVRMSDERLPKRLLYGELSEERSSTGGQRKRYKDSFQSSLIKGL